MTTAQTQVATTLLQFHYSNSQGVNLILPCASHHGQLFFMVAERGTPA